MATSWFTQDFNGNTMVNYLTSEEINIFENKLEKMVLETFSYLDVPNNYESEAFYHAFVMGLLRVDNDYYEVTSNRESGYGRYDVILKPKVNDIPAYIIEFKLVRDNSNFDETIETAFKQIEEMKYEVSVKDYDKVIKMAIAFKGKKLRLETKQIEVYQIYEKLDNLNINDFRYKICKNLQKFRLDSYNKYKGINQ